MVAAIYEDHMTMKNVHMYVLYSTSVPLRRHRDFGCDLVGVVVGDVSPSRSALPDPSDRAMRRRARMGTGVPVKTADPQNQELRCDSVKRYAQYIRFHFILQDCLYTLC